MSKSTTTKAANSAAGTTGEAETFPSTSNISSGYAGMDAMITQMMGLIATQAKAAQKQSLLLDRRAKKQTKQNNRMLAGLNAELAANANPSDTIPPAPGMSNAEVQQAADQVRIDAARRTGQRASILAGNTTSGTLSPATGLRSLLG